MDTTKICPIAQNDLDTICELERLGYPEGEPASPAQLSYRFNKAGHLFWGYYIDNNLVAYLCGTRCNDQTITAQSMHEHVPDGQTLCIHSLCVNEKYRRQEIASKLLKRYIRYVQSSVSGLSAIALISHENLLPLYEKAGFVCLGKSCIVLGQLPWYECQFKL